MSNKTIPTPIAISIIVVAALLVAGLAWWQWPGIPRQKPIVSTPISPKTPNQEEGGLSFEELQKLTEEQTQFFGSTATPNQRKCSFSLDNKLYCVAGQYLLSSINGGKNWRATKFTSTEVEFPALAIDSRNNIHIVWSNPQEYLYEGTTVRYYDIRYKEITKPQEDIAWINIPEEVINATRAAGTNYDLFTPSIAIDPTDQIHIVWSHYQARKGWSVPYYVHYRKKTLNGWDKEEVLQETVRGLGTAWNPTCPSIAIDSRGNVHLIFKVEAKLLYQKLTELGWGTPEIVNEGKLNKTKCSFSLAVDSKDNIHVVWEQIASAGEFEVGSSWIDYRRKSAESGWGPIEKLEAGKMIGRRNIQERARVYIEQVFAAGESPEQIEKYIPQFASEPSISVDSTDKIHVVWKEEACVVWGGHTPCIRITHNGEKLTPYYRRGYGDYFFPNLIWARWPELNGRPVNVLNGYAFITTIPLGDSKEYTWPEHFFNAFYGDAHETIQGFSPIFTKTGM